MSTCAAYGCSNKPQKKIPGISFHKFPVNLKRRAEWIKSVRRVNFKPTRCSQLCSEHFTEDMIDRTSLAVVRLRENAVPTLFKGVPIHHNEKQQRLAVTDVSKTKSCDETEMTDASNDGDSPITAEDELCEEKSLDHSYSNDLEEDKDSEVLPNKDIYLDPSLFQMLNSDVIEHSSPINLTNCGLTPDIINVLSTNQIKGNSDRNRTLSRSVAFPPTSIEDDSNFMSHNSIPMNREYQLEKQLKRKEDMLVRYRKKLKVMQQTIRRQRKKIIKLQKNLRDIERNRTSDEDISEGDLSESEIYGELLKYQKENDNCDDSICYGDVPFDQRSPTTDIQFEN